MRLGLAYLSQGDMPLAKSKLLRALTQNPDDASVNSAIAYFFEKTEDNDLADKYYQRAVRLSDYNGSQLNNYAIFLCRLGQYQKANRYFMLAINDVHYADTAKAFENAGFCSLAAGYENRAIDYFKQAISKDQRLKKSLVEVVRIELRNKHIRKTCKILKRYLNIVIEDANLTKSYNKYCL